MMTCEGLEFRYGTQKFSRTEEAFVQADYHTTQSTHTGLTCSILEKDSPVYNKRSNLFCCRLLEFDVVL